jgi:hypothetical protein
MCEASASRVASSGTALVFRFSAGSEVWHGCQQGALRGEHRGAAALSRLVETAAMHSMHPAAPMPPPSGQLLEPPPALQLDSVAAPAAAEAAAAAADVPQHGEEGPTPRSSSRVRNNRRGIKAAAAASVRALEAHSKVACATGALGHAGRALGMHVSSPVRAPSFPWHGRGMLECQLRRPHGLASWTPWQQRRPRAASAPPLQASHPAQSQKDCTSWPQARYTELSFPVQKLDAMQALAPPLCPAGAKSSILSVIPPDTPDDGPAAGNARRQSTASSMMT